MSKVKIEDSRTRYRSAVFICNYESISHLFQVFLLMTFDYKFQDILWFRLTHFMLLVSFYNP